MKSITFLAIGFLLPVLQASVAISQTIAKPEERIICAQLAYLKEVKQRVAKSHWPDFGRQVWEGEIRIMTPQSIFIVNPEKASLDGQPYEECACPVVKVVRLKDTVNTAFVMNTNFYDGIAACSDWSISHKVIPGIDDTESWILMVLHEMFHQFQSRQPAFREQFMDMWHKKQYIPQDSVGRLYKKYPDFQEQVQQENDLLLSCLQTDHSVHIDSMLHALLQIRQNRLATFRKISGFDIEPDENFEQIAEAGARYIEYHFATGLVDQPADESLAAIDANYRRHELYKSYSLQDQGRYLYIPTSKYFYALGFNSIRLLEKLGFPFRERLYSRKGVSFTALFKEYLETKK
ncbi:hypothetical protein [Larkinella soli]|uniref:hypothetical protein n=1 Tax=Larkinella soli TaxID=1770527 RepID=UPI000FFC5DFA|nr:hypothetical protein [Larkinella soli]